MIGGVASFGCSVLLLVVIYSQFMSRFKVYVTKKADEVAVEK